MTRFLTKKQNILLAVLVGLFQMGVLFAVLVKAVEMYVLYGILGDEECGLPDCPSERALRWEYTSYSALTLICVLVQIPYLKMVSNSVEQDEQRDTLMTTEDAVDS